MISAVMKCQLLDEELLEMTKEAVSTIKPYVDELILVNQGSVVGVEWLKTTADVYLANDVSKGFPDTVKQGMDVAKGEYVVILNNDIKFQGDWVTPLVELLKEPNVGLVHPKMLNWGGKYEKGDNIIYNPAPTDGMFFSAFILDPVIYRKIGGWDTDYDFWGYDDWDYYYRLLTGMYNAVWTDKVCYWHKGGATIAKIGRDKFSTKNRLLFQEKHGIDPHRVDWKFL
jgi:GT2 family glycosyltransferase